MTSAHFTKQITAAVISCNENITFGVQSKVSISKKGIFVAGAPILTFPTFPLDGSSVSLKSTDNTSLSLNGDATMLNNPRTSNTDINRNNKGETRIWNGENLLLTVNESGLNIKGTLNILQPGDVNIGGNVVTDGNVDCNSINVSKFVQIGSGKTSSTILTFLNDTFTSSIGTSSRDNNLSITSEANILLQSDSIRLLSKRGITLSSPTFRGKWSFCIWFIF